MGTCHVFTPLLQISPGELKDLQGAIGSVIDPLGDGGGGIFPPLREMLH